MQDYELVDIGEGRYAKQVKGKIVGVATPGEVYCYDLKQKYRDVDPGVIEISIAITGIAGILVSIQTSIIVRALAGAAFLLGLLATSHLYWTYILMRLPVTMSHYLRSPSAYRVPINFWLLWHYPKLMLRFSWFAFVRKGNMEFEEHMVELGYLTLLAGLFLTAMASTVFVFSGFL